MDSDRFAKPPRLPQSTPMVADEPALRGGAAEKVEALLTSRVAQFNSYSCSAASAATVLNAIRRLSAPESGNHPLSQQEILSRVDLHHWRERVSDAGYRGRHGMSLHDFGEVVQAALQACRIHSATVETVEIHPRMNDLPQRKARLRRVLEFQARSPGQFLIAHFTQAEYFGQWYGGHISPVGAFDRRQQRVLVLDVDPECPTPYWVAFDRFFEGLIGRRKTIGAPGGGDVNIQIEM